jgi:hypothetical protein
MLVAVTLFSDADFSKESDLLERFIESVHERFIESIYYSWPEACSNSVVRLRSENVAHGDGLVPLQCMDPWPFYSCSFGS